MPCSQHQPFFHQLEEGFEFVPSQNLLRCDKKHRFYYTAPRWQAPGRCICPVMPHAVAAKLNPTSDDEWSSEDEEGVRSFFTKGAKEVRAESTSTRLELGHFDLVEPCVGVIKDGARPILEAKARIKEEDALLDEEDPFSPPDLREFAVLLADNFIDEVQGYLDAEVHNKCIHCELAPCSWSVHRAQMVEHAKNVLVVGRNDNARELSSKRKALCRKMSQLLNGHMGKGNRKPQNDCFRLLQNHGLIVDC